ncbi:hypothetical protein V2J09_003059 [Rumex salicifolius]
MVADTIFLLSSGRLASLPSTSSLQGLRPPFLIKKISGSQLKIHYIPFPAPLNRPDAVITIAEICMRETPCLVSNASMDSQSNRFEVIHSSNLNSSSNSIDGENGEESMQPYFLERFYLFKTRSNFYLVGRDRSKKVWRVLKIDRSEPSELVLYEDPTEYSWSQCNVLLQRIHDGNRHVGGRKFVSTCYGIIGFIKFLAPYYMLLITKRRKMGEICGHPIYTMTNYRLIRIPHKSVRANVNNHTDENRYQKLLRTVDLTKDFYFSYSYPLMHTVQRNLSSGYTASTSYGSTSVWNEFMTREIRKHLKNMLWTVALVHGFFKQVKLSSSGCEFWLTLVARRSRLNAGTRYLRRGVNEKGEAANDVEIEQIVCEKICDGAPYKITSIVQNRGSIPLLWFQPTSWLNLKPDIIILNVDDNYEATRLHFEALSKRYGNPIFILNLVKSCERKPRESILSNEFDKAVKEINIARDEQLEFQSLDLNGQFKIKGTSVLARLDEMAENAMDSMGFFSYKVAPPVNSSQPLNINQYKLGTSERKCRGNNNLCKRHSVGPQRIQKGVIRTNCIDCIDRTNVAQFVQGSVALGHQLEDLGLDSGDEVLMYKTMEVYKKMGDALAWQYGGSASRSKIFSVKRGEWKPATKVQEMIKTLQRYFSNFYLDVKKQNGIDLFLGFVRPGAQELDMMVLESDYSYDVAGPSHQYQISSSSLRSQADQSNCILCEGWSYRTPENVITYQLEAFTSDNESQEASHSADTSEIDVLGYRSVIFLACCYHIISVSVISLRFKFPI